MARPVLGSAPAGVAAAPIAMRGDSGEGDALDEGELHADEATDAGRLDDGGDATGEQIRVDEVDQRLIIEIESGSDNEGDDHGACVKREDVLNTQNGEFPEGGT